MHLHVHENGLNKYALHLQIYILYFEIPPCPDISGGISFSLWPLKVKRTVLITGSIMI